MDRLHETTLDGDRHSLRPGVDSQLVEDRAQVVIDGAGRDEELPPNGFVGERLHHARQYPNRPELMKSRRPFVASRFSG
jgi:hypothetical protein